MQNIKCDLNLTEKPRRLLLQSMVFIITLLSANCADAQSMACPCGSELRYSVVGRLGSATPVEFCLPCSTSTTSTSTTTTLSAPSCACGVAPDFFWVRVLGGGGWIVNPEAGQCLPCPTTTSTTTTSTTTTTTLTEPSCACGVSPDYQWVRRLGGFWTEYYRSLYGVLPNECLTCPEIPSLTTTTVTLPHAPSIPFPKPVLQR